MTISAVRASPKLTDPFVTLESGLFKATVCENATISKGDDCWLDVTPEYENLLFYLFFP